MTVETPDQVVDEKQEVAPTEDVTLGPQEQQFLAALLALSQVAAVLTTPEQKIVAAVIQRKVSGG